MKKRENNKLMVNHKYKFPKLIVVFDIDQTLIHQTYGKIYYHPEFDNIFRLLNNCKEFVHVFLYTNGLTHLIPSVKQVFSKYGDISWLNENVPRRYDMVIHDVFAGGKRCNRPVSKNLEKSSPFTYKWGRNPPFDLRKSTYLLRSYLETHYNISMSKLPRIIMFDDCQCLDSNDINNDRNGWSLYSDHKFKLYHTPFNGVFDTIFLKLFTEILKLKL